MIKRSWIGGRGSLEFLKPKEIVNGERYKQVLEDKLEFFMTQHGTSHFQQDRAPSHWSRGCQHLALRKATHQAYHIARE
jgi:hypothetical protein